MNSANTRFFVGVDVGSTTTKLVAVDEAGEVVRSLIEPTRPTIGRQVERLLAELCIASLAAVVATGYGRNLVSAAARCVTEITCHARGAFASFGAGCSLIDIGGQDSKVIRIDGQGKVAHFAMNDKCAAGTGRFLEYTASRLDLSLARMDELALSASSEVNISTMCTVFAETEIVGLLARGEELDVIVRGLFRAFARRISALAKSEGVAEPILLAGGGGHSNALRTLLAQELGCSLKLVHEPQLNGAYGAALLARG